MITGHANHNNQKVMGAADTLDPKLSMRTFPITVYFRPYLIASYGYDYCFTTGIMVLLKIVLPTRMPQSSGSSHPCCSCNIHGLTTASEVAL